MLKNFWSFLDLYRCGAAFPGDVAIDSFGMPLVKVARKVIWHKMNKVEEQTLTTCLTILITQLEYRKGIAGIPLSTVVLRARPSTNDDVVKYIAESLIATVKVYDIQLRGANQYQLAQGVEWACDAMGRGVFVVNRKQTMLEAVPFLTRSYVDSWQESMEAELKVTPIWTYDELILPEGNQECR